MRIVIALGGNALGYTPDEQMVNVDKCISHIMPLIKEGHDIVITHGNGPQVGLINSAFEEARKTNAKIPMMPFPECGAMSQGYIGFHLQNALQNQMLKDGIKKSVIALITQVEVDSNDPAFSNPTKPIGSFYTKEEAMKLPYPVMEDSGRGYRRVVASPKPKRVLESDVIDKLVSDAIVITVGGGGIPVILENDKLQGVPAVIDKDFASAKLASDILADMLIILTQVENVKINFRHENEENLGKIQAKLLAQYNEEGHFMKGSMKPKVEACLEFLKGHKERVAIITSIDKASLAINGAAGTIIYNEYE